LIPSTLEYSRYEVECDLAKAFKEWDVLFPVILQLFIVNKVRDTREQYFDVIDVNFLRCSLTEHRYQVGVAVP